MKYSLEDQLIASERVQARLKILSEAVSIEQQRAECDTVPDNFTEKVGKTFNDLANLVFDKETTK